MMLTLFLLVALPVRAEDGAQDAAGDSAVGPLAGVGLHGAHDVRARYWRVDERLPNFEDRRILDYGEIVDHLDLLGTNERWGFGFRGDAVALPGNRYILDGVLTHERDLTSPGLVAPVSDAYLVLEKAYVERRGEHAILTVGDSYVAFGRGLALNLVKNNDVDIDTSLRGGRVAVKAGNWDLTAVAGSTNPQQVALENPNVGLRPNDGHAVTAARVERYGLGPINVGAHLVGVQFDADPLDATGARAGRIGAGVAGATVEAIGVAGLDLYAEADLYRYDDPAIAVDSGWAAYVSAVAYPGKLQILAEGRASRNAEYINAFSRGYEIAAGPSLEYERAITEDSSAAVNSNDIAGGRVTFNALLSEGERTLLPYLAIGALRDSDLGGLHFNRAPETIVHPVAGVQWAQSEFHLAANVGERRDFRDDGYGTDVTRHFDLDVSVPIASKLTLELAPSGMTYAWGDNAQQQSDYVDLSNALALKIGAPWALIFYTDYSSNPLINSTGNLAENAYGAVEGQWMPDSSTTVKLFAGAYRAGIRCAGGQCRSLPGFEGVKFSYGGTF